MMKTGEKSLSLTGQASLPFGLRYIDGAIVENNGRLCAVTTIHSSDCRRFSRSDPQIWKIIRIIDPSSGPLS